MKKTEQQKSYFIFSVAAIVLTKNSILVLLVITKIVNIEQLFIICNKNVYFKIQRFYLKTIYRSINVTHNISFQKIYNLFLKDKYNTS